MSEDEELDAVRGMIKGMWCPNCRHIMVHNNGHHAWVDIQCQTCGWRRDLEAERKVVEEMEP